MSTKRLSRRTMLVGAGVALALPWMEAMAPRGAKADSPSFPTRFVTFHVPNGIYMEKWTPADVGAGYTLPAMLSALAPLKSQLQILSNLGNPIGVAHPLEGGHSVGTSSMLTGHLPKETLGADIEGAISVDQIVAAAWRGRTRFPSLELGTVDPADTSEGEAVTNPMYTRHIAWAGPQQPLPKELNARQAFVRLFSTGGVTPLHGHSVLDYVLGQAGDLQKQLGARDRAKLDEYMSSVRDVETRLGAPAGPAPTVTADAISENRENLPVQMRAMLDVLTLALQTDATRVITYMFGNATSGAVYSFLGMNDGHHGISHHNGDPAKLAQIEIINTWEIQQLAYLLTRMQAVREGDGTLLDHSIVYFTSEVGDGSAHTHTPLPILVAGKAGGALKTGRHLQFDANPPIWDLYATFLQAMRLSLPTLGGLAATPLPALFT